MSDMRVDRDMLMRDLGILVSAARDRVAALQSVAELVRSSGRYRWVGLYVGDVAADPRYLTAFGTTKSEIIVPVFDRAGGNVVGTIDAESEKPNAFPEEVQMLLEAGSKVIRPLWRR